MSVSAVIAALVALCKAVPALTNFLAFFIGLLERWEEKRNEKTALERLEEKNDAVDARIDAAVRMLPLAPVQQRAADESARLPSGSAGGPGVVQGSAQDD